MVFIFIILVAVITFQVSMNHVLRMLNNVVSKHRIGTTLGDMLLKNNVDVFNDSNNIFIQNVYSNCVASCDNCLLYLPS